MPAECLIVNGARGTWVDGEIVNIQQGGFVWGDGELNLSKFYRFIITDKTPAEVSEYLAPWNRVIDMNVIAGPDPSGTRRINVRNNLVNASGTVGQWTTENTNNIIAEWNSLYPDTNLFTVDIPSPDVWTCEGTFTSGQAAQFEHVVIEYGLAHNLKRRIWSITPAGMQNIANAGGTQSGTAQQFGQILQNGLDT